jgi:hypothetical protein
MDETFKREVLRYRYGFEKWERKQFGNGGRGTQAQRRENFKIFLIREGASKEVSDFSLTEFIPLRIKR